MKGNYISTSTEARKPPTLSGEGSIETGKHKIAIHFDLYNGQVAFIKLDEIEDDDEHWITRVHTDEGMLFNIDQNYFVWDLTEVPVGYKQLSVF